MGARDHIAAEAPEDPAAGLPSDLSGDASDAADAGEAYDTADAADAADEPAAPDAPAETAGAPMWLDEIGPCGTASGFLQADPRHPMLFVRRRRPVLLVTFDNLSNVGDRAPGRLPWAYKFARDNRICHLGVYAHLPDWYRDADLIARLDKLAGEGFFEGYERCVFAGSSMGAFAALSFGRLAPGATVLAFNPQSTLDEALVPWETRYRAGRRQDWSLPMSDAAEAIAALGRAYVFYDPYFEPDRRHIARLTEAPGAGERLVTMKCWFSNHKSAVFLRKIEALKPVMHAALFGDLTEPEFYRLYRGRRRLPWYRGSLVHHFQKDGRSAMADRATRAFRGLIRREGRIGAGRGA
ncbi:MAG: hypothetical protein Kow0058_14680 [Roseovarius sp.]